MTTALKGAEHKYVNYTMNYSPDLGRSWLRFGPAHNISRAMAGQWSVMPKILQLPGGQVMLAGGRPGIMVWIGGRKQGTEWQAVNIASQHNAGLPPAELSTKGFERALTTLGPSTAPVPNHENPILAAKCCSTPNCTVNGAWCQTTAYSSLMAAGGFGSGEYVITYDRLANGWGGPPGQVCDHQTFRNHA